MLTTIRSLLLITTTAIVTAFSAACDAAPDGADSDADDMEGEEVGEEDDADEMEARSYSLEVMLDKKVASCTSSCKTNPPVWNKNDPLAGDCFIYCCEKVGWSGTTSAPSCL